MGEPQHGVDVFLDCCDLHETDRFPEEHPKPAHKVRPSFDEEEADLVDEDVFCDSELWRDVGEDGHDGGLPVLDTNGCEEIDQSATSPSSLRGGRDSDSSGSPASTGCSPAEQRASRKRVLADLDCDVASHPKKFRLRQKHTVSEEAQRQIDAIKARLAAAVSLTDEIAFKAILADFRAKPSVAHQRAAWVALWIKTRPHGYFHRTTAYITKKDFAYKKWNELDWEGAETEYVAMVRQHAKPAVRQGAPDGNENAKKKEMEEIKATAVMVCWNMPPCKDEAFLELYSQVQAVDPEDVAYDELLAKVKSLPAVHDGWTDFQLFLRKLKDASLWGEQSECMELSLCAEEPRWHFHVVVSNVRLQRSDRQQGAVVVPKEGLQGLAPHPDVKVSYARGRSAEAACQRLHCYCQWPKCGSIFTRTNFPRGKEFVCRASWTLAAWQLRKLSYRAARKEIISNRDSVEQFLAKIQAVWDAEVVEYMRSRKEMAVRTAEGKLNKFKTIFKVECWKSGYDATIFRGGLSTRFPFLVLEGPSKYGKTRFACNLWGIHQTFVAQCQGVQQPSLAGYDPRVHKAIVLDEPSRDLVNSCKVFLQASLEGTEMYQSPTQRFTRWVWVYGVPIIVCTNEWLEDSEDDANAQWIRKNSVHILVTDYLWERD